MRDVTPIEENNYRGNKNPRKTTNILIFTTIAIILVGFLAFFSNVTTPKEDEAIKKIDWIPNTYVYDKAEILNDDTKSKVNAQVKELDKTKGEQIVVVTVPTLAGNDIEGYSHDLFKESGFGQEGENKALLLLIAKDEKRVRIEVGYGLEGQINDGKAGRILDKYFVPYREKDDYNSAVVQTVDALSKDLNGQEVVPSDNNQEEEQKNDFDIWDIIWLIILLYIFYKLFMSGGGGSSGGGRRRRSNFYYYPGGGTSWSSGGSFGGSGGGFSGGGFGGGSSGGGGASR